MIFHYTLLYDVQSSPSESPKVSMTRTWEALNGMQYIAPPIDNTPLPNHLHGEGSGSGRRSKPDRSTKPLTSTRETRSVFGSYFNTWFELYGTQYTHSSCPSAAPP